MREPKCGPTISRRLASIARGTTVKPATLLGHGLRGNAVKFCWAGRPELKQFVGNSLAVFIWPVEVAVPPNKAGRPHARRSEGISETRGALRRIGREYENQST
jgi:hypothetical protein